MGDIIISSLRFLLNNFDLVLRIVCFIYIIYFIRCYYKIKQLINLIDNTLDENELDVIKSSLITLSYNLAVCASISFVIFLIFGSE